MASVWDKNGACYVYTLLPYSLHSPPATNGLAPSVLGIRDLHYALNPAEGPLLRLPSCRHAPLRPGLDIFPNHTPHLNILGPLPVTRLSCDSPFAVIGRSPSPSSYVKRGTWLQRDLSVTLTVKKPMSLLTTPPDAVIRAFFGKRSPQYLFTR